MGHTTITQLVILQALGLGVIAYVGSAGAREGRAGVDRSPTGVTAFETREAAKTELRGILKCPMNEVNTGQSCTLQFTDRTTGQTLRIVASNTAMRLYQNGQTQVVATGTISGDSLRIFEIRAE